MKYYILTDKETHFVLDYTTDHFEECDESLAIHVLDLDEWPKPEPKPLHDAILTYDGASFDAEYRLNLDDVNARKLTLTELLDDNDYKNLKNFEKVWWLKAKYPGITDSEIIKQLPYNPIEVGDSHEIWRNELNELLELVPDTSKQVVI